MKVIYCGGCNPHIDRDAVAGELQADDNGTRAVVYLSGCPRACASGHLLVVDGDPGEEAGGADRCVVVAGELVDDAPTRAADITTTVMRKLKE